MESKIKRPSKADVQGHAKNAVYGKERKLSDIKNLTAQISIEQIKPVGNNIVVRLKAWPAQSQNGVFVSDSYTVIRGEMYVTEIVAVGEDVKIVKAEDVAILSMYSGHHVTTQSGHSKIISESDILIYKSKEDMDKPQAFDPATFNPGINYVLVKVEKPREIKTDGGILLSQQSDGAFSKNDVVTKTGNILAFGKTNEYGKKYKQAKVGSKIIFDSYVGLKLNVTDVADPDEYLVMLSNDILATV